MPPDRSGRTATKLDLPAKPTSLPAAEQHAARASVARICALADQGDAQAQLTLGQMLLDGVWCIRDETAALGWFLAAARQNTPMGYNMVGRCCELGLGVRPDPAQATMWYLRAAEAGLDWGMYNYATRLMLGEGVANDRHAAFTWYERAAGLGHAKSITIIGGFYEDGWAVARDMTHARACYVKAAAKGDFRAHFNLGRLLLDEGNDHEARRHFDCARETAPPNFIDRMDQFLYARTSEPAI